LKRFGLIGYPLSHSFSKKYFSEKFTREGIHNTSYDLYPIADLNHLKDMIRSQTDLCGLNVTIPYKTQVIPYLDNLDPSATAIGAVNAIKINRKKGGPVTIGYNTDSVAFGKTLEPLLDKAYKNALVLGTGGAAKAVSHALSNHKIQHLMVSRNRHKSAPLPVAVINYTDMKDIVIKTHQLIINTTPLGMHPNTEACPDIPYESLTEDHLLYDLIYNPLETHFLSKGKEQGARIKNGKEMLGIQAELSWQIWNPPPVVK
jgi:shikimate dehydrogenase